MSKSVTIAIPFISMDQHRAIMEDFQTILDNPPVILTGPEAHPATVPYVHNMGFAFNGPNPYSGTPCRYHPGTGIVIPSGTHQPYEAVATAAAILVAHHVGPRYPKTALPRLDRQMVLTAQSIIQTTLPELAESCSNIIHPDESELTLFIHSLGDSLNIEARRIVAKLLAKPPHHFLPPLRQPTADQSNTNGD